MKTDKQSKFRLPFWALYIKLLAVAFIIFFLRFPGNFTQPNFFAEDGTVFAENIIEKGLPGALVTPFNGYFIWGPYLLAGLGMVINLLTGSGELVNLPASFALVSYAFLAFCATLPVLLLRNILRIRWLLLMAAFICFVPLPGNDYSIIGELGNLKFAFVYIAFLLLVARHNTRSNSKIVWLLDAGLLVCAYTNITVYLFMPFALVKYWPDLKKHPSKWIKLLKDPSFVSLLVLGGLLLPQLILAKVAGIPAQPGYLDMPFEKQKTIEILLARPYLFGIFYGIYRNLNDTLVIVLLGITAAVAWWATRKQNRVYVIFGSFCVFVTTLLFVVKRPGVSAFFFGYKSGGPDNFFFTQNMIMAVVAVFVMAGFAELYTKFSTHVLITGLLLVISLVPVARNYSRNDFMPRTVGTIKANSKRLCASRENQLVLPIYPVKGFTYTLRRDELCTPSVVNSR